MRIPDNSKNQLLSLLMNVSESTFLQVIQHKHRHNKRYQSGVFDNLFTEQLENQKQALAFFQEASYQVADLTLNVTAFSPQFVKIECTETNSEKAETNTHSRRAKLRVNNLRFEILLFHKQQLPQFVQDLGCYSEHASTVPVTQANQDYKHPSMALLSAVAVVVEGLQLIDHYQKLTSDSLTKLQSRTSLQQEIDERSHHSSIVLCMIHCIDFQHVNRKFGQAQGDNVLQEIASIINDYTRNEDVSGRFGGALFGIAIEASSIQDGHKLAVKLQNALHSKPYLSNAIRLNFNLGVAFMSHAEAEIEEHAVSSLLINRAEQALKAAQNANVPSIVQWEPDKFNLDEQEFNYLGGIFTPDNVTNYRNMLLLWDISSIIADEPSFSKLLHAVIERLAYTFEFEYAGIISNVGQTNSHTYKASETADISVIQLDDCEYANILQDTAKIAISNAQHAQHEENEHNALLIPLGTATQECFFILGEKNALDLTHDSIMLFVGFARQIGKSLRRSQLEDELNKKLEEQNAQLAQELIELKAGMQSSALVYRSARMQKIVEQTQRAAQSDATVLITGESGTGKEKLINAIHTLGPRSEKALVIVDCGSIPETLIESELFGHLKGAFTGAQNDNKGKIQAASGGLLVLDEIGELPLSMQPKLLRFVQEKQYTPVGSTRAIKVDVKIIAVTNRDLAYEVSQGKFRKDLYYRLNVVTLHNPPLRERSEDIDLLVPHFLSKFARQFEIDRKMVSAETIQRMRAYDWPGNIRELENKLMQASLLTSNNEISFTDLQLEANQASLAHHSHSDQQNNQAIVVDSIEANNIHTTNSSTPKGASEFIESTLITNSGALNFTETQWESDYCRILDQLIQEVVAQEKVSTSIGAAIESRLLHMAYDLTGSHSKTALLLYIPVSTARRRLLKPQRALDNLESSHHWQTCLELLKQVVKQTVTLKTPLESIRHITADRILHHYSSNMTLAAQLMGVSEPTMYKLRKLVTK